MYDSFMKRFYAVDPMLEFASPYCYAGNNPVSFIHLDGCKWGTKSCISLIENAEEFLDFYDHIIEYWEIYGKYPIVRVRYLNTMIP